MNRKSAARLFMSKNQPQLMAFALLIILFLYKVIFTPGGFSVFSVTTTANGATAVSIASVGETLVILTGGFDLSVGAILSLLNVIMATHMHGTLISELGICALVLALGTLAGAINGMLVAWLRIQPIIATLATGFVWTGCALLVLGQPGGMVPEGFMIALTGDIGNVLPAVLIVLAVVILVWLSIKNSRLGTRIYSIGSDRDAAIARGVNVRRTLVWAYAFSGLFYGMAAIFLSAQTGSGDPNIGAPLLLEVFAAVAVGGTVFGGGRGGAVGSIFGAFILELIAEALFVAGVSDFYINIFQGIVLLVAASATALSLGKRRGPLKEMVRQRLRRLVA